MIKFRSTVVFLSLMLVTGIALSAPISDASIDKLLQLSGLNKQLNQLPGTVRAGIMQARQRGMNIPDAEFTEMVDIIAESFRPTRMVKSIRSELKNNLSSADAKNLLSWYESAEGKALTKAEEAASTPESYNAMLKNAKTLLDNKEDVAMAQRVEKAINSVDMAMQIQMNTGAAVYTALMTAAEPTKPVNMEPFKANISKQEAQIRSRLEQLIILSLVNTYKDVEDATMNKYVAFLEQPDTQKFNTSIMKGMNNAINQSIDVMSKDLATVFSKLKKSNSEKK